MKKKYKIYKLYTIIIRRKNARCLAKLVAGPVAAVAPAAVTATAANLIASF
jgi:hypothetical protein